MTTEPDLPPNEFLGPDGVSPETPDENTMDLTGIDPEGLDDLQAFADQVAEATLEDEAAEAEAWTAAKAKLEELEQRAKEDHERHLRLLSDFTNFRNRTQKEIQLAVDLSEKKLLLEILPVLDNFDRCLASTYQSVEDFRAGVDLIRKQFLDHLRRLGVTPVLLEVGAPFDAAHAEALTTQTSPELPDGAVAAIYEKGYLLRESLLRPARVVVNHRPGGVGAPPEPAP